MTDAHPLVSPQQERGRYASILTACVIAGTAVALGEVIGSGFATLLAETHPEVIASLDLWSADALSRLSEKQRLPDPDADAQDNAQGTPREPNAALDDAKTAWATGARALEAEPFNSRTLRILGQIADQEGDTAAALRLMKSSVARSLRETLANIWLANVDLSNKNYAQALNRVDAIIRTSPSTADLVRPVLVGLATTPEATDDLAILLAQDPPWRANFLASLPSRVRDVGDLKGLYLKLMAMHPPLANEELRPYLFALIQQNLIEQAYYLWLKTLPENKLADLGYLYNGDFQTRSSNLPFDWSITPIQGAKAEIKLIKGDVSRQALSVEFGSGGRVPFQNVTQMTLLPPGQYRLAGEYKTSDLQNRRGMAWRVYCAETGTLVGETPRVSGTSDGWLPFETDFTVPDTGCRAQWLRLELAFRVDIEQEVSGVIWFDNMYIQSVGSGTALVDPTQTRIKMPTAATNFEQAIRRPN